MTRGINSERPFGGRRGDRDSSEKGVVVAVRANCTVETDKAICCFVEEGPPVQPTLPGMKGRDPKPHAGEEIWVPKSQVHDDSEVFSRGDEGKLIIKPWFANKEKWG